MYKNGFCANIKQDGRIVEDINGVVAIKFGEYSLRLKNKTNRDAVCSVSVDSKCVTEKGDLIIHANDTVELERFVESVHSGRKFKFVSLDDVSLSEKDNPKNGIVEVRFRLTKMPTERIIYHHPIEHHYYYPQWNEYSSWTPNVWHTDAGNTKGITTFTAGNINNAFYCSNSTSNAALNTSSIPCSANISDVSDGKTVEGSYSDQKFGYSYCGMLESEETVIHLKLVGYEDKRIVLYPNDTRFCKSCGNKAKLVDKFCSKCGNKF